MNKFYAAYNQTGEIQYTFQCQSIHDTYEAEIGLAVVEVDDTVNDSEFYVIDGAAQPKQPFTLQMTNPQITADGIDECLIGNIPAGTTVQWPDGQADEVTDGEVRFSVDLAGTYTLRFSAIPYLDQEVTIEAVVPV